MLSRAKQGDANADGCTFSKAPRMVSASKQLMPSRWGIDCFIGSSYWRRAFGRQIRMADILVAIIKGLASLRVYLASTGDLQTRPRDA